MMPLDSPAWADASDGIVDPASSTCWTRGELRDRVARLAERLSSARGGLAFLMGRNSTGVVANYLAFLQAGCPVLLLDPRSSEAQLRGLIDRYRPEVCAMEKGIGPASGYLQHGGDDELRLWWRTGRSESVPSNPDLAVLLSTSGSTGSPKLVRLARRNIEANADSIRESLDLDAGERGLACLPIHYSYGLSVLNSHFRAGATVVLTDEPVVSPRFWKLVRSERCTSMPGVPYTYELLARLGFERLEAPTLRTLTQAGGRLDVELVRRFQSEMRRRGGRFIVMYGQTEATARIACVPWDRLQDKMGSAGAAIPGGRLSIEVDGVEVAPGIEGEVVYRGPNVMMGYAESREDLARGDDLGGVLRTGDLGRLDRDGFLFLTGRLKRIAKVMGVRISLDEVEARLRSRGPTAAVASGDGITLFCSYGDPELYAALARELAKELRTDQAAFVFRRMEQLPLTASGKVDYPRLLPA